MPIRASTAARASQRPGSATRDSGSRASPATSATRISGTLTRKAACQGKCWSRKPPTSGPAAAPSPDTAAQTPSAVARSAGSVKSTRIIDSVVGRIIAPPTPSRARTAITPGAASAAGTSSEAPAKSP